jgi:hypothetical protein
MGFYIRKAFNFGPLRVNLAKSGIGVSFGVKSVRISMGKKGAYFHKGRYSLYYWERIGSHRIKPRQADISTHPSLRKVENISESNDPYEIKTADIASLGESSSEEVLSQINIQKQKIPFALFVAIGIAGLTYLVLQSPWIVAVVIMIIGLILTTLVHKGDKIEITIPLFYELNQEASEKFSTTQKVLENLVRSERISRITPVKANRDWKHHAGAPYFDKRKAISVGQIY